MAISPINFVSGFGLVPLFAWVPVDADTDAATPAPPSPSATGVTGTPDGVSVETSKPEDPAQQKPAESAGPKMKLVFVGFQWGAEAGIATFPRPDWMSGLAGESDDPSDPSTRRDDHRQQNDAARGLKAAIAARSVAESPTEPPTDADNTSADTSGQE